MCEITDKLYKTCSTCSNCKLDIDIDNEECIRTCLLHKKDVQQMDTCEEYSVKPNYNADPRFLPRSVTSYTGGFSAGFID